MPNRIDAFDDFLEEQSKSPARRMHEEHAGISEEEEALAEPGFIASMINPAEIFVNALTGGGMALRAGKSALPALKEAGQWASYGIPSMAKSLYKLPVKIQNYLLKAIEESSAKAAAKGRMPQIGGLPAKIESGSLTSTGGRFTHGPSDIIDISEAVSRKQAMLPERGEQARLPQYAGPTARTTRPMGTSGRLVEFPGGIPSAKAYETRSTADKIQDIINDLMRESLRAKGMID